MSTVSICVEGFKIENIREEVHLEWVGMVCALNTHSVFQKLCIYLQCFREEFVLNHLVWQNDEDSHILFMNIIGLLVLCMTILQGPLQRFYKFLVCLFFSSSSSTIYTLRADRFNLIIKK